VSVSVLCAVVNMEAEQQNRRFRASLPHEALLEFRVVPLHRDTVQ